jgi:hypothetical protein
MASKRLAQHRAAQSRLYPLVISVEAFEVLKIGLGADARRALDYNPLPEIFEWRREVPQENPVLKG